MGVRVRVRVRVWALPLLCSPLSACLSLSLGGVSSVNKWDLRLLRTHAVGLGI